MTDRSTSQAAASTTQTPPHVGGNASQQQPISRTASDPRLHDHGLPDDDPDESSSLLANSQSQLLGYSTSPSLTYRTPRPGPSRMSSALGQRLRRSRSLNTSGFSRSASKTDLHSHYNQFTTVDWVHDNITDAERQKSLANLPGLRGALLYWFYSAQSWVIAAIIGVLVASLAYTIDISEVWLFDIKNGYCRSSWKLTERRCCAGQIDCTDYVTWGQAMGLPQQDRKLVEYAIYVLSTVVLASLSCMLAMRVKLQVPSSMPLMRMDDDLVHFNNPLGDKTAEEAFEKPHTLTYPATGSGVAEVRVILSGFVVHGYLGTATLIVKALSLVLSVAAGLSLGKEGPLVHCSTAVANVVSRAAPKFRTNDGKRREMLSAGAASGVAVAFGAPISGVLFALEEVSYYFASKTLFRSFFASIVAAVTLKFLNPYGTSKIVLFQVHYRQDWKSWEMIMFIFLGVIGGAVGALFIKSVRVWARTFRSLRIIKRSPLVEVVLIALLTGLTTFWNPYTKNPVAELMYSLASECQKSGSGVAGYCPLRDEIPDELWQLATAFLLKAVLTTLTFGIKVPAGIYIPSMLLGGLMGRFVGNLLQYMIMTLLPESSLFGPCTVNGNPETCVVPGVYALVTAGAVMCGTTRLTVTIAVILFELTGSLDHVLPFSIAVLCAKWTADAIEPLSIYDLLTETNDYPFLDNKTRPKGLTGELGDITSPYHSRAAINISDSSRVRASVLSKKLEYMHKRGELDGGLPIVRDGILVGFISAPELEYALDKLAESAAAEGMDEDPWCQMVEDGGISPIAGAGGYGIGAVNNFAGLVDPSPIALDIHSNMELVYEAFVKLGLRSMCVLREGAYYGMVHRKQFVRHVRELKH